MFKNCGMVVMKHYVSICFEIMFLDNEGDN